MEELLYSSNLDGRRQKISVDEAETLFKHDTAYWRGEVLEVDEQEGCLYVGVEDLDFLPSTGYFFVRPFEFLTTLDAVYNSKNLKKCTAGIAWSTNGC
ncbi:MAG: hypothetical protein R3C03_17900 [Pirellulaceae bacterium]